MWLIICSLCCGAEARKLSMGHNLIFHHVPVHCTLHCFIRVCFWEEPREDCLGFFFSKVSGKVKIFVIFGIVFWLKLMWNTCTNIKWSKTGQYVNPKMSANVQTSQRSNFKSFCESTCFYCKHIYLATRVVVFTFFPKCCPPNSHIYLLFPWKIHSLSSDYCLHLNHHLLNIGNWYQ